jgi:hypothetical protein
VVVDGVTGLKATHGGNSVLLNWNKSSNVTLYRVEYTNSIGDPGAWQLLGETDSNFLVDRNLSGNGSRYYRIVGKK